MLQILFFLFLHFAYNGAQRVASAASCDATRTSLAAVPRLAQRRGWIVFSPLAVVRAVEEAACATSESRSTLVDPEVRLRGWLIVPGSGRLRADEPLLGLVGSLATLDATVRFEFLMTSGGCEETVTGLFRLSVRGDAVLMRAETVGAFADEEIFDSVPPRLVAAAKKSGPLTMGGLSPPLVDVNLRMSTLDLLLPTSDSAVGVLLPALLPRSYFEQNETAISLTDQCEFRSCPSSVFGSAERLAAGLCRTLNKNDTDSATLDVLLGTASGSILRAGENGIDFASLGSATTMRATCGAGGWVGLNVVADCPSKGTVLPPSVYGNHRALQGALRAAPCRVSALVRGANRDLQFLECDALSGGGCGSVVPLRPLAAVPASFASSLVQNLRPPTAPGFLADHVSQLVPEDLSGRYGLREGGTLADFLLWLRAQLPHCMELIVGPVSATVTMHCDQILLDVPASGVNGNIAPAAAQSAYVQFGLLLSPGAGVYSSSLAGNVVFSLEDLSIVQNSSTHHNWGLVASFSQLGTKVEVDFVTGGVYAHSAVSERGGLQMLDSSGKVYTGSRAVPHAISASLATAAPDLFPSTLPSVPGCDLTIVSTAYVKAVQAVLAQDPVVDDLVSFCVCVHDLLPVGLFRGVYPDQLLLIDRRTCKGTLNATGTPWDNSVGLSRQVLPLFFETRIRGTIDAGARLTMAAAQTLENLPVALVVNMQSRVGATAAVSFVSNHDGIAKLFVWVTSASGISAVGGIDYEKAEKLPFVVQDNGYPVFADAISGFYLQFKTMLEGVPFLFSDKNRDVTPLVPPLEKLAGIDMRGFALLEPVSPVKWTFPGRQLCLSELSMAEPVVLAVNGEAECQFNPRGHATMGKFASALENALSMCGGAASELLTVLLSEATLPADTCGSVLLRSALPGTVYQLDASGLFASFREAAGSLVSANLDDFNARVERIFGAGVSYYGPTQTVRAEEWAPADLLSVYPPTVPAMTLCFAMNAVTSTQQVPLTDSLQGRHSMTLDSGSAVVNAETKSEFCFVSASEFIVDDAIVGSTNFGQQNLTRRDAGIRGTLTLCVDVVVRRADKSAAQVRLCEDVVFDGSRSAFDTFRSWQFADSRLGSIISFASQGADEVNIIAKRSRDSSGQFTIPMSISTRSNVKGIEEFKTPPPAAALFLQHLTVSVDINATLSAQALEADLGLFEASCRNVSGVAQSRLVANLTERSLMKSVMESFNSNTQTWPRIQIFVLVRSAVFNLSGISYNNTSVAGLTGTGSLVLVGQAFEAHFGDASVEHVVHLGLSAGKLIQEGLRNIEAFAKTPHLTKILPFTAETRVGTVVDEFVRGVSSSQGSAASLAGLCSNLEQSSTGRCSVVQLTREALRVCVELVSSTKSQTAMNVDLRRMFPQSVPVFVESGGRESLEINTKLSSRFCLVVEEQMRLENSFSRVDFSLKSPQVVGGHFGCVDASIVNIKTVISGSMERTDNGEVVIGGEDVIFSGKVQLPSASCSLELRGTLSQAWSVPTRLTLSPSQCGRAIAEELNKGRPVLKAIQRPREFADQVGRAVTSAVAKSMAETVADHTKYPLIGKLVAETVVKRLLAPLSARIGDMGVALSRYGVDIQSIEGIDASPRGAEQFAVAAFTSALCTFLGPHLKECPAVPSVGAYQLEWDLPLVFSQRISLFDKALDFGGRSSFSGVSFNCSAEVEVTFSVQLTLALGKTVHVFTDSSSPVVFGARLHVPKVCALVGNMAFLGAELNITSSSVEASASLKLSEGTVSMETRFAAALRVTGRIGFAGPLVARVLRSKDPFEALPTFWAALVLSFDNAQREMEITLEARICAGDILGNVGKAFVSRTASSTLKHISPFLDTLQKKVPMTTVLAGRELTIAELAEWVQKRYGGVNKGVVEALRVAKEVSDYLRLLQSLPASGSCDVSIDFGKYQRMPDKTWKKLSPRRSQTVRFAEHVPLQIRGDVTRVWQSWSTAGNSSFRICSLEDLLSGLLGAIDNDNKAFAKVNLLTWTLPPFEIGVKAEWRIKIWGPIDLVVGCGASVRLSNVTLVYNMGSALAAVKSKRPGLALNGIQLVTRDSSGKSVAVVTASVYVSGALSFNIKVAEARAGVSLTLTAEIHVADRYKSGQISLVRLYKIVKKYGASGAFSLTIRGRVAFFVRVKVCVIFCDVVYNKCFPVLSFPIYATRGNELASFVSSAGVLDKGMADEGSPVITLSVRNGMQWVSLQDSTNDYEQSAPEDEAAVPAADALTASGEFSKPAVFVVEQLNCPLICLPRNMRVRIMLESFCGGEKLTLSKTSFSCGGQPVRFSDQGVAELTLVSPPLVSQLETSVTGLPTNIVADIPGLVVMEGPPENFAERTLTLASPMTGVTIISQFAEASVESGKVSLKGCGVVVFKEEVISLNLAPTGDCLVRIAQVPPGRSVRVAGEGHTDVLVSHWHEMQGSLIVDGKPLRMNSIALMTSGPGSMVDFGSSMEWTPEGSTVSRPITHTNVMEITHIFEDHVDARMQVLPSTSVSVNGRGTFVVSKCGPGGGLTLNFTAKSVFTIGTDGNLSAFDGCVIRVFGNNIAETEVVVLGHADERPLVWNFLEVEGRARLEIGNGSFLIMFEDLAHLTAKASARASFWFRDDLESTQVMVEISPSVNLAERAKVSICRTASAVGIVGAVDCVIGPRHCDAADTSDPLQAIRSPLVILGDTQTTVALKSENCSSAMVVSMISSCLWSANGRTVNNSEWARQQMAARGLDLGDCEQLWMKGVKRFVLVTGRGDDRVRASAWSVPTDLETSDGNDLISWGPCPADSTLSPGRGFDVVQLTLPLPGETVVVLWQDEEADIVQVFVPRNLSTMIGTVFSPTSSTGGSVRFSSRVPKYDDIYVMDIVVSEVTGQSKVVTVNVTDPGTAVHVIMQPNTTYDVRQLAEGSLLIMNGKENAPSNCVVRMRVAKSVFYARTAIFCATEDDTCVVSFAVPDADVRLTDMPVQSAARNEWERFLSSQLSQPGQQTGRIWVGNSGMVVDLLNVQNVQAESSGIVRLDANGSVRGVEVKDAQEVRRGSKFDAPLLLVRVQNYKHDIEQPGRVVLHDMSAEVVGNKSVILMNHTIGLENETAIAGPLPNAWFDAQVAAVTEVALSDASLAVYACKVIVLKTPRARLTGLGAATVSTVVVTNWAVLADRERTLGTVLENNELTVAGSSFSIIAEPGAVLKVEMEINTLEVRCTALPKCCLETVERCPMSMYEGCSGGLYEFRSNGALWSVCSTSVGTARGTLFVWPLILGFVCFACSAFIAGLATCFRRPLGLHFVGGTLWHLTFSAMATMGGGDFCAIYDQQRVILTVRQVMTLWWWAGGTACSSYAVVGAVAGAHAFILCVSIVLHRHKGEGRNRIMNALKGAVMFLLIVVSPLSVFGLSTIAFSVGGVYVALAFVVLLQLLECAVRCICREDRKRQLPLFGAPIVAFLVVAVLCSFRLCPMVVPFSLAWLLSCVRMWFIAEQLHIRDETVWWKSVVMWGAVCVLALNAIGGGLFVWGYSAWAYCLWLVPTLLLDGILVLMNWDKREPIDPTVRAENRSFPAADPAGGIELEPIDDTTHLVSTTLYTTPLVSSD